jgi:hypothetical protein
MPEPNKMKKSDYRAFRTKAMNRPLPSVAQGAKDAKKG